MCTDFQFFANICYIKVIFENILNVTPLSLQYLKLMLFFVVVDKKSIWISFKHLQKSLLPSYGQNFTNTKQVKVLQFDKVLIFMLKYYEGRKDVSPGLWQRKHTLSMQNIIYKFTPAIIDWCCWTIYRKCLLETKNGSSNQGLEITLKEEKRKLRFPPHSHFLFARQPNLINFTFLCQDLGQYWDVLVYTFVFVNWFCLGKM